VLGLLTKLVFLGAAQRRLLAEGLPIFTYHKISSIPKRSNDPYLYVTPERFDQQLGALRAAGFGSGSLDRLDSPSSSSAGRQAIITFDDGFACVLENGLDALSRHRFTAIQFVVAGRMGQNNDWDVAKGDLSEKLMDESQVREWLAAGHEIGSHSMTHRNLRHLKAGDLRAEVSDSKKVLEDKFGSAVRHFCYPYGSYNDAVKEAAAEAGYQTASTVKFGVNTPATSAFELRRIIPLSDAELIGKVAHRLKRRVVA
jgi:peptidoglycan/xylan/chitin deacetylase (PgdA/CDA1 family)